MAQKPTFHTGDNFAYSYSRARTASDDTVKRERERESLIEMKP